jgi:hypothetical protein
VSTGPSRLMSIWPTPSRLMCPWQAIEKLSPIWPPRDGTRFGVDEPPASELPQQLERTGATSQLLTDKGWP